MSIPGLGDAMTLWDLSQRVIGFINGLANAQDDLIALRAEAKCLVVSVNALYSTESKSALRFISFEQGQDLKTIVEGCKLNMTELNEFIGRCEKIAGDSYADETGDPRPKKRWFGSPSQFLEKLLEWKGKVFASWKFVWKDKQPMRDKLVLPAASINIFLTSLVHVRLSRMSLSNVVGTSKDLVLGGFEGWNAVGIRTAFRDANITALALMKGEIEDEIVAYALYLIRGGDPLSRKPLPGPSGGSKKPAGSATAKPKARRKSNYLMSPEKMYLVKDKKSGRSSSRVRADNIEIFEPTADSGSGSEGEPTFFSSPPPPPRAPSPRFFEDREPERRGGGGYFESEEYWGRPTGNTRRREFADRACEREYDLEPEDEAQVRAKEEAVRIEVLRAMKKERRDAIASMQETQVHQRRDHRRRADGRQYFMAPSEAEKPEDPRDYMERVYGVIIERVSESRPPVNAGIIGQPDEVLFENEIESDDSDLEEVKIVLEEERPSVDGRRRRKERTTRAKSIFVIPDTERLPFAEREEGPRLTRRAEQSLREREESILDREQSLRDREEAMSERERWLREHEQAMRRGFPGEGVYPEGVIRQEHVRPPRRTHSYDDESPPPRSGYGGQEFQVVEPDDTASLRHELRYDPGVRRGRGRGENHMIVRRRTDGAGDEFRHHRRRRSSGSDDDDDFDEPIRIQRPR